MKQCFESGLESEYLSKRGIVHLKNSAWTKWTKHTKSMGLLEQMHVMNFYFSFIKVTAPQYILWIIAEGKYIHSLKHYKKAGL